MGAPAKFLFDLDFSVPAKSRERAQSGAEVAAQLAEAETRAYRRGFEAAQQEAAAADNRRMTLAMDEIARAIAAIAERTGEIETRMETEAVDVALAVSRKLCAELTAREPLVEITALLGDCFRQLVATPHLVVRINDALYDAARDTFERLASQSGFQGRLIVLAEPDIAYGDARIEWADGGMVRERAVIDAKVDELVTRYLAPRTSGEPTGGQP